MVATREEIERQLACKLTEANIQRDQIHQRKVEIERELDEEDDPVELDNLEDQLMLLREIDQLCQKLDQLQQPAMLPAASVVADASSFSPCTPGEELQEEPNLNSPQPHRILRFANREELQETIQKMPEFSSKTLLQLALCLDQEEGEMLCKTHYELACSQLKDENVASGKQLDLLERSAQCAFNGQLDEAKTYLHLLLDELIPLKVPVLCKLIKTAEQSIDKLEDKDLLLLLGNTGVGKSTTVHHLVGTPLECVERHGHRFIAPTERQSEEMKTFVVSPFARSETRHMNAVRLPLFGTDNCFVCDSPGFFDTEGTEIDIANSVLIAKTAQVVKSLRVAFLISDKSIGDRINLLPESLKLLLTLIPKFGKDQDALLFLFTKFRQEDVHQFRQSLNDLCTRPSDEIRSNPQLRKLLLHMKRLCQREECFINPLSPENRQLLLDMIEGMEPLKYPSEAVREFSTQTSIAKINQYLRNLQSLVENSLSLGKYDVTQYLLSELKDLIDSTKLEQATNAYTDMCQKVGKHFTAIATGAVDRLTHSNLPEARLTSDSLNAYLSDIEILRQASTFPASGQGVDPLSYLVCALTSTAQTLADKSKELPLDAPSLGLCYFNLLDMSSLVPSISSQVEEVLHAINSRIQQYSDQAHSFLMQSQFNEFGSTLSTLRSVAEALQANEWLAVESTITSLSQDFQDILTNYKELVSDLFTKKALSPEEVQSLEQGINKLRSAAKALHLPQECQELARNIHQAAKHAISERFEELYSRVHWALKSSDPSTLNRIAADLKLAENYLKVQRLHKKYYNTYYAISSSVQEFMETLARKAEQLIEALNSQELVNYKELERVLKVLKHMTNTEQVGQFIRTRLFEDIKDSIKTQLHKQKNQARRYIFRFDKLETLTELGALTDQAELMQEATSVLEGMDQEYQAVFDLVEAKLTLTFDRIETYFDSKQLEGETRKSLDQNFVVHSYAFLERCIQTNPRLSRASALYNQLDSFIVQYLEQLKQEIDGKIGRELEITDAFVASTGGLTRSIQEALQWKESCQQSSWGHLTSWSGYVNGLIHKLQELRDDFSKKIDQAFHNGDLTTAELVLSTLERLARIDKWVFTDEQDCFGILAKHWDDEFRQEHGSALEHIERSLEARDFTSIPGLVNSLTTSRPQRLRIRSKVVVCLHNFVEEINEQTRELSADLPLEKLTGIKSSLEKAQRAVKHLPTSLSELSLDEVKPALDRSIQALKSKVTKFIKETKDLWISNRFAEANSRYHRIEEVQRILRSLFESEPELFCVPSANELETELHSKIDDMKPGNYIERPPKDLYDQLQRSLDEYPKLATFIQKMEALLIQQVTACLEGVYDHPYSRQSELTRLKSSLPYLPECIQRRAEYQLSMYNEKVASRSTVLDKLQNELRGNPGSFEHYLRRYPESSYEFSSLKSYLLSEIDCLLSQAERYLDKNQVSEAFESTRLLVEHLDIALRFKFDVHTIESNLRKVVDNHCKDLKKSVCLLRPVHQPEAVKLTIDALLNYADLPAVPPSLLAKGVWVEIQSTLEEGQAALTYLFESIKQNHEHALAKRDFNAVKASLENLTRWIPVFEHLFEYCQKNTDRMWPDLLQAINYLGNTMAWQQATEDALHATLNTCLQIDLTDKALQDFDIREQRIRELVAALAFLGLIKTLPEYLLTTVNFYQAAVDGLRRRITDTVNDQLSQLSDVQDVQLYSTLNQLHKVLQCLAHHIGMSQVPDTYTSQMCEMETVEIQQQIEEKLDTIYRNALELSNVEQFSLQLIKIKVIGVFLQSARNIANQRISELIENFKLEYRLAGLNAVRDALLNDPECYGQCIIDQHPEFAYSLSRIWSNATLQSGFDELLSKVEPESIDKKATLKRWEIYDGTYKELINRNSKAMHEGRSADFTDLRRTLFEKIGKLSGAKSARGWVTQAQDDVPELVAYLFALWTLQRTAEYNDLTETSVLLKPHPAQVLAVFRILGIGYPTETMTQGLYINNFAQVSTGEGKSIVIAIAAMLLALSGFEVSCVCYSEHLCKRDYEAYHDLFSFLGIEKLISYKTFNVVCEDVLNAKCDIRNSVIELITTGQITSASIQHTQQRSKVLIIDEVDIFFKDDFLGTLYSVSALLTGRHSKGLIDYVWDNKDSVSLDGTRRTDSYKALCHQCPGWSQLFDGAIAEMICSVKELDSHHYVVQDGRIGYVEQDGVSFNRVQSYLTTFVHYKEFGKLSLTPDQVGIHIKCGDFLYSELPKMFDWITGVTGTLDNLSNCEREMIRDMYSIHHYSVIPSVFPTPRRNFDPSEHVIIRESTEEYFLDIQNNITEAQGGAGKRPVLVFFETVNRLKEFKQWLGNHPLQAAIREVYETVSESNRKALLTEAMLPNRVTLLSRQFGRGVDFMCHQSHVLEQGGVHVIQTFFSEDEAEEVQIKGRTARQGKQGSYAMVLLKQDLQKFEGFQNSIHGENCMYDTLSHLRDEFKADRLIKLSKRIEALQSKHKLSSTLFESLIEDDVDTAIRMLLDFNQNQQFTNKVKKTILAFDATISMSNCLERVKSVIHVMFDRINEILGSLKDISIQVVAYRNYNSRAEDLLLASNSLSDPDQVIQFLSDVHCCAGWDKEAIEIALWYVNQQQDVSQVILIGDAPANTDYDIRFKREIEFGESYWATTQYAQKTNFTTEVNALKNKGIPVHTFYLDNEAQRNFDKIAKETGGTCGFLNIAAPDASEKLLDLMTENILRSIDERFAENYIRRYARVS